MLRAKFQDRRLIRSGEDFYMFFTILWARYPSWSCDHDRLKELSFPQGRWMQPKL